MCFILLFKFEPKLWRNPICMGTRKKLRDILQWVVKKWTLFHASHRRITCIEKSTRKNEKKVVYKQQFQIEDKLQFSKNDTHSTGLNYLLLLVFFIHSFCANTREYIWNRKIIDRCLHGMHVRIIIVSIRRKKPREKYKHIISVTSMCI